MKKFFLTVIIFILIIATLSSCNKADVSFDTQPVEQNLDGGISESGINLKSIDITTSGSDTSIVMSFIGGSRVSGVSESKVTNTPKYSAIMLNSPARLRVDLAVEYWDYEDAFKLPSSSMVVGLFNTIYSDKETISVYFQLNDDADILVTENSDKLEIVLKNKNTQSENKFFTGLNAYEEYEQNLIASGLEFSPTLCEGLSDKILISQPFNTKEAAQQFCDNANELIAGAIPTKEAYVFEMETKQLPKYNREINTASLNEKKVLLVDDVNVNLSVLVENGKYLTTTPEGNIIYARSYLPNYTTDTEQVVKERLWVIENSGRKTELALPDFYSVEKCETSVDGRYLAILDSGIFNKVLYVYDMLESKLYNMGEEGFGDLTVSFAWSLDQNIIYAMSGYNTAQLMQYDFSKPQGQRISSVEEKKGALGKIDVAKNLIYFVDSTATQGGEIYAVNINTHQRETLTNGIDFELSKNGKYMAVLGQLAGDEQQATFNLSIFNTETAQSTEIATKLLVEDYEFGADEDTLYYMTPTYEKVSAQYPFALLKYSVSKGESSLIGYCSTGKFNTSKNVGELYIIDYFSQDNSNFYITYIFNKA